MTDGRRYDVTADPLRYRHCCRFMLLFCPFCRGFFVSIDFCSSPESRSHDCMGRPLELLADSSVGCVWDRKSHRWFFNASCHLLMVIYGLPTDMQKRHSLMLQKSAVVTLSSSKPFVVLCLTATHSRVILFSLCIVTLIEPSMHVSGQFHFQSSFVFYA